MQKQRLKFIAFLLALVSLVAVSTLSVSAGIWDGNYGSGETGGSQTANGGYSIPALWALGYGDPNTIFGLRFSVYDTETGVSSKSVDVYRQSCTNAATYATNQRLGTKYNHKQLSTGWNSYDLTPVSSDSQTYWDTALGFALPGVTTALGTAINGNSTMLDPILTEIDGRALADLDYYDRILIEPIYPISIDGASYNLTVGEIATFGARMFGYDVAIQSSAVDGSWGYIADYTNRLFPNAVYAADGSNVFAACSEISGYATFGTILSYGYGTAITYNPVATEEPEYNLIVNYYNGSSKVASRTYAADADCSNGLLNYSTSDSTLYATKTGYGATGKWKVGSNSSTTKIDEDTGYSTGSDMATALGVDISSGDQTVNVYMDWDPNTLTVKYYSNYATYAKVDGTVLSTVGADKNVIVRTWTTTYEAQSSDTLHNYSTEGDGTYMKRTGYSATGYWGSSTSGGTTLHEDTSFASASALASKFGKDLGVGDVTLNLYAQWDTVDVK